MSKNLSQLHIEILEPFLTALVTLGLLGQLGAGIGFDFIVKGALELGQLDIDRFVGFGRQVF